MSLSFAAARHRRTPKHLPLSQETAVEEALAEARRVERDVIVKKKKVGKDEKYFATPRVLRVSQH